jgi:uncharacterized protein YgfB (UPF0149 family)
LSDLTALALNAAHQISVQELHGAVCGIAACGAEVFPAEDLEALLGLDLDADADVLSRFVAAAIDDLFAEDMGFMPLLTEDEAPMDVRLEALRTWCSAFLAGLACGLAARGMDDLDELPAEAQELIEDFAAIAEMDSESGDALAAEAGSQQQAEAALMELQEFVKVGVLLIASLVTYGADDQAG